MPEQGVLPGVAETPLQQSATEGTSGSSSPGSRRFLPWWRDLLAQPTTRDWNSRTGMAEVALDDSGRVPDCPNACHDTAQPAVAVIV